MQQQQQEHLYLYSYLRSKCKTKFKKEYMTARNNINGLINLGSHIRVRFSGHARHAKGTCIIHSDTDVFSLCLLIAENLNSAA